MIAFKKGLFVLFLIIKKPLFWFCGFLFKFPLTLGYRWYRFIKKTLNKISAELISTVTKKYALHIAIITLTFLVTATNIYAGDFATLKNKNNEKSILENLSARTEEEKNVTIEESLEQTGAREDTSYIANQAITTHDSTLAFDETFNGQDDGDYTDDDLSSTFPSPISNAVRVQPQIEDAQDRKPATRTQNIEYVVSDGDTIGSIAKKFGLDTETVLIANKLTLRSVIRSGLTLQILPVDGVLYTIKKGDTLSQIAKTYDTDVEKILAINNLTASSTLTNGTKLVLPDGKLPSPKPQSPPRQIASNLRDIFRPSTDDSTTNRGLFLWPTAVHRVTQYYKAYFKGRRHTGIDIAGPKGTPIYATSDGVVKISGWNTGGYGNMIIIQHDTKLFSRYGHASKLLVQAGDTVKRGDLIALMGSTGRSTGPHLHFEVMTGTPSNRVNPLDYIK